MCSFSPVIKDYPKDCQNIFRKLRNLALLEDNQALKGRQNTDGGATPGHVPPSPLPPPSRREGGGVINYRTRGLRVACPRL